MTWYSEKIMVFTWCNYVVPCPTCTKKSWMVSNIGSKSRKNVKNYQDMTTTTTANSHKQMPPQISHMENKVNLVESGFKW